VAVNPPRFTSHSHPTPLPTNAALLAVAGVGGVGVALWQVEILALSPALLKLLAMFTNTISKYASDGGATNKCTDI